MMNWCKNALFLASLIVAIPFFLIGFVAGFIGCFLRAGWHAANYAAEWLTW